MNILHSKHCTRKAGFTLLELVMGITLIIIVSVFVAVSIWDSVYSFRLSAASASILHDIRLAQQLAMSQNIWHGVEFSADPANEYHVYTTNGTSDSDIPNPANRAAVLFINIKNQYGVTISAVDIGGGSKVEFNPLGRPYLDMNGAPLALDGSLTLSGGGKSKIIQIFKGTGRAEIL